MHPSTVSHRTVTSIEEASQECDWRRGFHILESNVISAHTYPSIHTMIHFMHYILSVNAIPLKSPVLAPSSHTNVQSTFSVLQYPVLDYRTRFYLLSPRPVIYPVLVSSVVSHISSIFKGEYLHASSVLV